LFNGLLQLFHAVGGGEALQRIGFAREIAGRLGGLGAHGGRGGGEPGGRAGLLHGLEALHRGDQVLDLGRRDEADVRGFAAQEGRGVNEEAAAAAELEVGIQHRLAGGG
jgi:hypothetical protein